MRVPRTVLVAAMILTMVLGGCGSSSSPAPAATPAPAAPTPGAPAPAPAPASKLTPIPLKINYGTAVAYAPLMVAAEAGFFADAGIEPRPAGQVMAGTDAIQAMLGGSFDFVGASAVGFYGAVDKGVPITAVTIYVGGGDRIALLTKKDSGIKTPKDLIGKTVCSPRRNISEESLYTYFDVEGVDPKQVKVVPGSDVDLPAALASGSCQAGVTVEPYVSAIESNGTGVVMTRMSKYVGAANNVFVFPNETIQKNPETVKRFAIAHARAMQFLRQNPDKAVPMIRKYIPSITEDVIKITLKYYTWDPRFSASAMGSLEKELKLNVSLGWIPKPVDLKAVINPTIMQAVEKEYPQYFSDLK